MSTISRFHCRLIVFVRLTWFFFSFSCSSGAMTAHIKGDDKMGRRTGCGRVVTVKGTRAGQGAVASFAFYHGVFHDSNGVANG